jgi:hypothetical protein
MKKRKENHKARKWKTLDDTWHLVTHSQCTLPIVFTHCCSITQRFLACCLISKGRKRRGEGREGGRGKK